MDELDITKIRGIEYNFYTTCSNCNNWIEIHVGVNGIHTLEEGKKQIIKQNYKKGLVIIQQNVQIL